MSATSTAASTSAIAVRRATPADAAECGRICHEAFTLINSQHNFPPEIPSCEIAVGFMTMLFSHPQFYCVVAEREGKVIGSNCLDERGPIAGLGPITVDPAAQDRGAGRVLMNTLIARSREQRHAGIRLVQGAFHRRSMSLYAKLGFVVREPLVVFNGAGLQRPIENCRVRQAQPADIESCAHLCIAVHGHERSGELRDAIQAGHALVVERSGAITGYSTGLLFFGHSVAASNQDLRALIAHPASFQHPGFILPTRDAELFRWCLENGLRIVEPLTLMTMGLYNEPQGAYLPSILF